MKFGLFGINTGPCADPDTMLAVSAAAEAAGFESLWTGEHVVLPDPQVPPSPAPPMTAMVHPFTSLAYIASATDQILLGTGITLIAQRNAVVLAKETASVDHLSKGRICIECLSQVLNDMQSDTTSVEFVYCVQSVKDIPEHPV